MSVTITGATFEHHHFGVAHYKGHPASASSTPEGHSIEYDEAARVVGMTLTNVRWLLERDGQITVTLPAGHAVQTTPRKRCNQPHSESAALSPVSRPAYSAADGAPSAPAHR